MIPRIRGKVGQIEEPEELKDKWCFNLSLWTFDGETQIGEPFGPFGPFDSEEIAQKELMIAARVACEGIEKAAGFEPSGKYIDLKANAILRPWDEQ